MGALYNALVFGVTMPDLPEPSTNITSLDDDIFEPESDEAMSIRIFGAKTNTIALSEFLQYSPNGVAEIIRMLYKSRFDDGYECKPRYFGFTIMRDCDNYNTLPKRFSCYLDDLATFLTGKVALSLLENAQADWKKLQELLWVYYDYKLPEGRLILANDWL